LAEELPQDEDLLESEDDAPIIKLINAMLGEAIKESASDVHIETFEKSLAIRFRVDGVLRDVLSPSRKLAPLLVSRVKVMAKLDIAEKRVPQDGRISLRIGGRAVDVRVSTMPSSHGERVVMRLLDKNATRLDLHSLGMTADNHNAFRDMIQRPHGIILVTGPTGSGKSTTLYAGLSEINSNERNILTVEDPIEFDIDGIGQTQVNPKVDMTFARGLRAILRQDPDVVMIGEIRDLETAEIAVQASLTGHLVMSTLHTNTAVGAITRLRDMGIEPFLISSSLLGVLAQRLVRTLCPDCKTPYQADKETKKLFNLKKKDELTLYHAHGCEECNYKGYRGRTGIHELLLINDDVKALIHKEAGEQAIEQAIRDHTPSIQQDGLDKVRQGITSLEEVMRVTKES
jgi:general secretion pathway protein E